MGINVTSWKQLENMDEMKKLLIVSYFPLDERGSMTLWTNDKVSELLNMGFKIHLVTSPIIKPNTSRNCNVFPVFSINPSTFLRELNQGKLYIGLLFLPLILSFGLVHELLERVVLKRIGHGMWGWTIPSLIVISFLKLTNRYDFILSLGGPTSSHLATAIASKIFRIPSIIEFQDPIVGTDIGHNSRSANYFKLLEQFLVKNCSKIVFVTKQAAIECKERFPTSKNITYTYTSSPVIHKTNPHNPNKVTDSAILSLAYFGEVYSTRNYNSLFLALKYIKEKENDHLSYKIYHYGTNPNLKTVEMEINLSFNVMDILSRNTAMKEASNYDVLLLIQHTDERSKVTIPYKTWDYLNTQKPILALLNNDELKTMLDDLGHYTCNVNDIDSIVSAILRFHYDLKNNGIKIKPNPYEISKQVLELISL